MILYTVVGGDQMTIFGLRLIPCDIEQPRAVSWQPNYRGGTDFRIDHVPKGVRPGVGVGKFPLPFNAR